MQIDTVPDGIVLVAGMTATVPIDGLWWSRPSHSLRKHISALREAMTAKGHLEALPVPTLNADFQFNNPTFAGPDGTYRIAP